MKLISSLICMFLLAMTLSVLGCGGDTAEVPKTPEELKKQAATEITNETFDAEKQKLIDDINSL